MAKTKIKRNNAKTAQYIVLFSIQDSKLSLLQESIHAIRKGENLINIGLEQISNLGEIHLNYNSKDPFKKEASLAKFCSFLYDVFTEKKRFPNWLEIAIMEMHKNIHNNISIEQIAMDLKLSLPHFSRVFKQYLNITPLQYFQNLKINMAKSYLKETNMTISEIADYLAYSNEFNFSRSFKKVCGVSPSKYRNHSIFDINS